MGEMADMHIDEMLSAEWEGHDSWEEWEGYDPIDGRRLFVSKNRAAVNVFYEYRVPDIFD